jgi:hypothetical protein
MPLGTGVRDERQVLGALTFTELPERIGVHRTSARVTDPPMMSAPFASSSASRNAVAQRARRYPATAASRRQLYMLATSTECPHAVVRWDDGLPARPSLDGQPRDRPGRACDTIRAKMQRRIPLAVSRGRDRSGFPGASACRVESGCRNFRSFRNGSTSAAAGEILKRKRVRNTFQ